MAKYSEELKLKVVKEYLEGHLSLVKLAEKYSIRSDKSIVDWINAYKNFGIDGLKIKNKKQSYTVQFKLDVLHFMKQTGASYQGTATHFNMHNPSTITNWHLKFLKEGIEGLQEKEKGRPSMSKKAKATPPKQEKVMSREEQLERENELLRLEVAYLKKLKAFRENPDAFLEKHKQRLPFNSKKKDLD